MTWGGVGIWKDDTGCGGEELRQGVYGEMKQGVNGKLRQGVDGKPRQGVAAVGGRRGVRRGCESTPKI